VYRGVIQCATVRKYGISAQVNKNRKKLKRILMKTAGTLRKNIQISG